MRLLVVLSRFPYPLEKGDKLRAYHQIRLLSQYHELFLFVLSDKKIPETYRTQLTPFCKEIHIENINLFSKIFYAFLFMLKGLPLQCGYFFRRKAKKALEKFAKAVDGEQVYCQFVRTAEYVKDLPLVKTIDYQDALSVGMRRRYEKASFFTKPFFKSEYLRLQKYENLVFKKFDHHTIITKTDRQLMPVANQERIIVVGNGVDFQTFSYHQEEKIYDLIFAGNMGYAPNIEAANYLVLKILPLVRQRHPQVKLVLCGASPAAQVIALQSEDVKVTGWVDSIAPYYAQSKVFVAPMHLGTGLQNKLLEAMSTELPCVVTPLAATPLQGIKANQEILVCGTSEEFAESICNLLENKELYNSISQAGHHFVQAHYDWASASEPLLKLFSK